MTKAEEWVCPVCGERSLNIIELCDNDECPGLDCPGLAADRPLTPGQIAELRRVAAAPQLYFERPQAGAGLIARGLVKTEGDHLAVTDAGKAALAEETAARSGQGQIG